jgi:hypothetical protein
MDIMMPHSSSRLILVTPNAEHRIFHDWLSSKDGGMDRVHEISGRNELMTHRLGHKNYNKRCYALENERGGLLSVIYTHWMTATNVQGDESWRQLPGNIDSILAEPSQPLKTEPDMVVFYSISSFADKSGRPLIASVYDQFTSAANPPILTTLSPLRTLQAWLNKERLKLEGTEEARLATVSRYLKLKQDPVEKFHLGNGAQVGAIHFNASAEGRRDSIEGAGVMVNYRYPRVRARLQDNARIFRQENSETIPASNHLQVFLG